MNKYLITVKGKDSYGDPEIHYHVDVDVTDFDAVIDDYLKTYQIFGVKDVEVSIERIEKVKRVAYCYDN